MRTAISMAAVAVSMLSAMAAAQQSRVLPAGFGYATRYGDQVLVAPYGFLYGRFMIVYDNAALGFTRGTIGSVALRRDGQLPYDYQSKIKQVTVRLGSSDYTPNTVPDRFSAVPNAPMTTVFAGAVSLPFEPVIAPVLSTFLPIATTPWVHDPANGNLVVEIEGESRVIQDVFWGVDAHFVASDAADGTSTTIASGPRCFTSGNDRVYAWVPGLKAPPPGEDLRFYVQGRLPATVTAGVAWLGFVRGNPIDLTPIGAPTCLLHVDPVVFAGLTMQRYGGDLRQGELAWPVPPLPSLNGGAVALQAAVVEPAANALGLVPSDAVDVRLGSMATRAFAARTLYTVEIKTDLPMRQRDEIAPIVELRGAFQ